MAKRQEDGKPSYESQFFSIGTPRPLWLIGSMAGLLARGSWRIHVFPVFDQ